MNWWDSVASSLDGIARLSFALAMYLWLPVKQSIPTPGVLLLAGALLLLCADLIDWMLDGEDNIDGDIIDGEDL